jgi:hypothetical protein
MLPTRGAILWRFLLNFQPSAASASGGFLLGLPVSPFDQVRDDLEEHAEVCPEPAAYFLLTYADGSFQVTAVADRHDPVALDLIHSLTKPSRTTPTPTPRWRCAPSMACL